MNALLFLSLMIFAWAIISQLIAWMITPGQNEDAVLESWFAVFMLPAALLFVGVWILEDYWRRLAYRWGLPSAILRLFDR